MRNIGFIGLIILLFYANRTVAQTSFEKFINSNLGIVAEDLIKTRDGGFMLTGKLFGSQEPILVVKIDSTYNFQWTISLGDSAFLGEHGRNVIQTLDNGYFINTGGGTIAEPADIGFMKIDSLGSVLWCHSIGAFDPDEILDIIETSTGSFLVVGYSYNMGPLNGRDLLIMKISKSGDLMWSKTLGGNQDDYGRKIIEANNLYYVFGYSDSFTQRGIFVMATDTSGNILWAKIYGSLQERLLDAAATPDGGFIVSGASLNNFGTSSDTVSFILKIDSLGNEIWMNSYKISSTIFGIPNIYSGSKLVVTGSGDILLCRSSYLLCLDSLGQLKWNNQYDSNDIDGIVIDDKQGFLMFAQGVDSISNMSVVHLIKADSLGRTNCSFTGLVEVSSALHIISDTVQPLMAIHSDTLASHSTSTNTINAAMQTVCANGTGIYETENMQMDFQIYPNPFLSTINIVNHIRPKRFLE